MRNETKNEKKEDEREREKVVVFNYRGEKRGPKEELACCITYISGNTNKAAGLTVCDYQPNSRKARR